MKKQIKYIFGIVYLFMSYIIFFIIVDKLSFVNYSKDLLFLFSLFNIFIFLHFIFDIKIFYDFLYRKRYYIGLLIFLILVIGKYNGSSIELMNSYVQPEKNLKTNIVFGVARPIRSDEWLVSTPFVLTQTTKEVNFSSHNQLFSARDNLVTLFPNLPSFDISMLSSPQSIGFLFLDTERAFSFYWYLPYFILFFSTFEMFMILTKKKRLYAFTGAIMVTLSPVVQWWQSASIPAYGALAVTLFYYLICCKNKKKKLLLSFLFGYSGYLYIMCLYPAWQVPYGYIYLILLILLFAENKKKIKKKDYLYLISIFLVIIIPIIIIFKQNYDVLTIVNSTVYPGARMSIGGGEWRTIFTYVLDIFFPYKKGLSNPCEIAQYLSLFPISIVYSFYILKNKKKKDLFLIMSNIVLIFLFIWELFPLPSIISRLLLISMSTEARVQSAIGYLSVIQIIYILSNYERKKSEKKLLTIKNILLLLTSALFTFITIKISNSVIKESYPNYINLYTSIICLVLFSIITFLFLYNYKKSNLFLCLTLISISVISGIIISPINKGLSILYKKPLAKEIRKIVKEDKNAVFIVSDSSFVLSNYLTVNGAKTINSTNQVPNLELYYKLDPELRYDNIYNRYHHLSVNLTKDKTNFVLNTPDYITLNINYDDLCITNADYIVTNNNDTSLYSEYKQIYNKYKFSIYKTNCKKNS